MGRPCLGGSIGTLSGYPADRNEPYAGVVFRDASYVASQASEESYVDCKMESRLQSYEARDEAASRAAAFGILAGLRGLDDNTGVGNGARVL